jgi:flagellar biogenesis protein FliO
MIIVLLLAYILLYLVKRIKRYSNTPAQVVAIVELVLMAVLAVVCAVSEFVEYSITFGGPCQIFGIALWVRGASGVYTGYYCDSDIVKEAENEKKEQKKKIKAQAEKAEKPQKAIDTDEAPRGRVDDFTVWRLTLAIVLITAGTYLFVKPAFEKIHLQWFFSCAIIVVACFFVVLGFALKPRKIRVENESPVNAKPEEPQQQQDTQAAEANVETAQQTQGYLESGKVKINIDNSANAMTKTAVYDAIDEKSEQGAPKEEPKKSKKQKKQ